jgi:hypothetical protein
MAGLAVVADGIEKATESGSMEAEQQQSADDHPQEQIHRHEPERLSGAQRLNDRGDMRLARHHVLAVDDHHAAGHEPRAESHDQRLDSQQRHPDPVDQTDDGAEQDRNANRGSRAGRGVGGQEISRAGRHARDREIDAAGQHDHGLTAAHDRERRGEQHSVRRPERRYRAGPHQLDAEDENRQQQDKRKDRVRAQEAENEAHLRSWR